MQRPAGRPRKREPRKAGPSKSNHDTQRTPSGGQNEAVAQDSTKPEKRITCTPENVAKVLVRIAEGLSLRKACEPDDLPSKSAFLEWVSKDDKLADQYARAMVGRADTLFDDYLELASKATPENANAIKVQLDAHKWAISKLAPKKYGEFQRMELTGKDQGPVELSISEQIRRAFGDAPGRPGRPDFTAAPVEGAFHG